MVYSFLLGGFPCALRSRPKNLNFADAGCTTRIVSVCPKGEPMMRCVHSSLQVRMLSALSLGQPNDIHRTYTDADGLNRPAWLVDNNNDNGICMQAILPVAKCLSFPRSASLRRLRVGGNLDWHGKIPVDCRTSCTIKASGGSAGPTRSSHVLGVASTSTLSFSCKPWVLPRRSGADFCCESIYVEGCSGIVTKLSGTGSMDSSELLELCMLSVASALAGRHFTIQA